MILLSMKILSEKSVFDAVVASGARPAPVDVLPDQEAECTAVNAVTFADHAPSGSETALDADTARLSTRPMIQYL
jgi:hypothetical protein